MDAYRARMELQGRVVAGLVGECGSGYVGTSGFDTSVWVDIICLVHTQSSYSGAWGERGSTCALATTWTQWDGVW